MHGMIHEVDTWQMTGSQHCAQGHGAEHPKQPAVLSLLVLLRPARQRWGRLESVRRAVLAARMWGGQASQEGHQGLTHQTPKHVGQMCSASTPQPSRHGGQQVTRQGLEHEEVLRRARAEQAACWWSCRRGPPCSRGPAMWTSSGAPCAACAAPPSAALQLCPSAPCLR